MKRENPRRCIVTKRSYPKGELYRLVTNNDNLTLDLQQNLGGRAVYIHRDEASIKKAYSKHLLSRYASEERVSFVIEEMLKAL